MAAFETGVTGGIRAFVSTIFFRRGKVSPLGFFPQPRAFEKTQGGIRAPFLYRGPVAPIG